MVPRGVSMEAGALIIKGRRLINSGHGEGCAKQGWLQCFLFLFGLGLLLVCVSKEKAIKSNRNQWLLGGCLWRQGR